MKHRFGWGGWVCLQTLSFRFFCSFVGVMIQNRDSGIGCGVVAANVAVTPVKTMVVDIDLIDDFDKEDDHDHSSDAAKLRIYSI